MGEMGGLGEKKLAVVRGSPVEAEQAASGADPAECDASILEVILEHPVVPSGLRVHHRPDGEPVDELHWVAGALEGCIRLLDEGRNVRVHRHVGSGRAWLRVPFEEGIHRAHDRGVPSKRADHVRDACRLCGVRTSHRRLVSAQDANGESFKKKDYILRYGEKGCATYGRNGLLGGLLERRQPCPPPRDPLPRPQRKVLVVRLRRVEDASKKRRKRAEKEHLRW